MTGRIIHYSEPVEFHKALPGAKSMVIWKRDDTPAVARTAKPKNIPNSKRVTTMANYDYNTSRGPYHAILDKMARARQAITGETYAKAFTETYLDPANAVIRDGSKYDALSKAFDSVHGTAHSLVKAAKAAPYDPLAKAAEMAEHLGPNHARLHSMAVDHMRARAGMSYESAYAYLYGKPENESLRNAIKAEHMRATMAGLGDGELGKAAAPADAVQDDVDPGSAEYELHSLVVTRMKNEPNLSYQQAFTHEYLAPANRSLKERVTSAGLLRMQAMAPAKPFPRYTSPGHDERDVANIGRSGAKPVGYAGG